MSQSTINLDLAEAFLDLWHSVNRPKFPITNGREMIEALTIWQNPTEQFPLLSQIAIQFGCSDREAYIAAEQLREMGFNLPEKEDEARFAPKETKKFDWVKFAEMIFQTQNPQLVAKTFSLSREACEDRLAMLIAGGIELPEMVEKTVPQWLIDHARMILHPHKFTPEEKRSIGSKYRVMRPKHKKCGYYNGTGCYRPTKGDKYRPSRISIQEWGQILRVRQQYSPQVKAKASPSFDHYKRS